MSSRALAVSLHRLQDDMTTVGDFHEQAVPVQRHHAVEGVYANRGSLNVSRLAVPDHGNALHVEGSLAAIGQDRLAVSHHRQSQVRHQRRGQGQRVIEAGVYHGSDLPRLPRRAEEGNRHNSFEIGVHEALYRPAFCKEPPPKWYSA